jgi:hypothetical protein
MDILPEEAKVMLRTWKHTGEQAALLMAEVGATVREIRGVVQIVRKWVNAVDTGLGSTPPGVTFQDLQDKK